MTDTHTPGPWEHYERVDREYPYGVRSQGGKAGEGPCHLASVRWGAMGGEANAKLIAAAPALLEALEAFLNGDASVSHMKVAYEDARFAVARAKGEK